MRHFLFHKIEHSMKSVREHLSLNNCYHHCHHHCHHHMSGSGRAAGAVKVMTGQLLANSSPTQLITIIIPTITKIIIIALIKIFIIKLMTDKIKNRLTSKLMLMIQCLFQPNVKIIYILTLIMNSMMRMMLAMFNDGCAMLVTLMITMLLLQCQWFVWELTLELLNLRWGGLLQFQIGIASVYWQCILFCTAPGGLLLPRIHPSPLLSSVVMCPADFIGLKSNHCLFTIKSIVLLLCFAQIDGFVKVFWWISPSWYMDLSNFLDGFL